MYDKLPVGAVVRLRNDDTAVIIEKPKNWPGDDGYPVIAVICGAEGIDSWTSVGEYIKDKSDVYDMVAVVHYGNPAAPDPDIAEIDRLIDQLRDLGIPTPKTCGSLVPPEQRQAMIQTLRGMFPPERVKSPVVAAVAAALKPINRIERKDVEDFRNGNYCERNALDQYQTIATKSAIYPGQGTPFGVMYAALGLAEAGEIQNKVKKMFRDDGVIDFVDVRERETVVRFNPITPERRAMIVKEMGGNLWYLAALAREIGTTLSEVAGNNLDELCGRTDRDTLNGDGDNR